MNSDLSNQEALNYVCVNCGASVATLYKKYNSDVLKLIHCGSCDMIADKYIEYEAVIILIDLILFKKEPYRHILFNTEFKRHWKLWVLTFLLKTYVVWVSNNRESDRALVVAEHAFYVSALITVAGAVTFLTTMLLGVKIDAAFKGRPFNSSQTLRVWKALALSEFGQFLLLPSLVWTDVQTSTHYIVVMIYVVISRLQALTVVTSCSRLLLLQLLLLSTLVESNVTQAVRSVFYPI